MQVLVATTGRSGSAYLSRLLTASGLPCGHEEVFGPGGPDQQAAASLRAEVSWLSVAHLADVAPEVSVWHQTRHPLRVISSFRAIGFFADDGADQHGAYRRYAERHFPEVFTERDELTRCAAWWVELNRRIERHVPSSRRYRVEDVTFELARTLIDAAGRHDVPDDMIHGALRSIPRDSNARQLGEQLGWASLPPAIRDAVEVAASEYGYDPGDLMA